MDSVISFVRKVIPPTETNFYVPSTWVYNGAVIDLDFANGRYWNAPSLDVVPTDLLSISRASIGYAKNSDGTLTQFASGELRIGVGTGLLVEGVRTNKKSASQAFTDASWNIVTNITITDNVTVAPDGTTTASSFIPTLTSAEHYIRGDATSSVSADGKITLSCYFKASGYNYAMIMVLINGGAIIYVVTYDLINAVVVDTDILGGSPTGTSQSAEVMANGWVRCVLTMDVLTGQGISMQIGPQSTSTYAGSWSADGSSGVYAWGAQIEEAAFPSSYIPTTTTSAARAQDVVSCIGNLGTILSALPHSIVADVITLAVPNNFWAIIGSDGDNSLYTNNDNTVLDARDNSGHGLQVTIGNSQTWTGGTKAAIAQATGDRFTIAGGGTGGSDTFALAYASPRLGNSVTTAPEMYGYFRRLTVWNTRLANATLQALTAP